MEGQTLKIYEDGEIYRDFIYVDDVVNACHLVAQEKKADGEIYNVGTGIAVNIVSVARELLVLFGKSADDYVISGFFRDGDIKFACADISKIELELGWKAKISISQGLAQLASWVKEEIND